MAVRHVPVLMLPPPDDVLSCGPIILSFWVLLHHGQNFAIIHFSCHLQSLDILLLPVYSLSLMMFYLSDGNAAHIYDYENSVKRNQVQIC